MPTIIQEYHDLYQQELRELLHQRTTVILWTMAILLPLFSLPDYHGLLSFFFNQFLAWRLVGSLFCLFLLFVNQHDENRRYPFFFSIAACLASALTISPMVVQIGGYASPYYVGFILVFIIFAAILPLTMSQAAILGGALFALYALPVFSFNTFTPAGLREFVANSFFFITFIIIIVVRSHAENQARINEFNLRMKERKIGTKLGFYAGKLEDEVRRRTIELNKSESRYRDLYENIIDDVILVDQEGRILLANPRFYQNLHLPSSDRAITFLDLVHPDDLSTVKNTLLTRLQAGKNVTGCQFRLAGAGKALFEVECNATVIRKEGNLIGFQMLLRNVTTRLSLEKKLMRSLQTLQQTRIATILGLAKLSEYRDVHSSYHLERIREYSLVIAEELSAQEKYQSYINDNYMENLSLSSILHDVGKVSIPDEIILKPARLTAEENEIVKQHTTSGGDILKEVDAHADVHSFLAMAKTIAYFHHEKWDGSGYPYGLRQEEIPLAARIVALADVYDALTSARNYRQATPHEEAVDIIARERGRHFAPDIVDAFTACSAKFNSIRVKYQLKESETTTRIEPGEKAATPPKCRALNGVIRQSC